MKVMDWLPIAISCVALLVSILSTVLAWTARSKANNMRAEALRLSHGQAEIVLRNQVSASRHRVEDFMARNLDHLGADDTTRTTVLRSISKSLAEGYLSALDVACQTYLDEKIDQERFQRAFQREIRQAVQDEAHKEFLAGHAYNALTKVYEAWENPEKGKK